RAHTYRSQGREARGRRRSTIMTSDDTPLRLRRPLGTRISDERLVRNLTQKELAARAGLSLDGLQHIETNRRPNPRIRTVWRIANALGMTVDALLTEEPPVEPEEWEDVQ